MKYLILVLFLLVGFSASADVPDQTYGGYHLFEMVNGENIVDNWNTVRDDNGKIIYQSVEYKDGSKAIFNSYFNILDLEERRRLTQYDNAHPVNGMLRDSLSNGEFVISLDSKADDVNDNNKVEEQGTAKLKASECILPKDEEEEIKEATTKSILMNSVLFLVAIIVIRRLRRIIKKSISKRRSVRSTRDRNNLLINFEVEKERTGNSG